MIRHRVGRDDRPAVTFPAAVASSSFDVREGGRGDSDEFIARRIQRSMNRGRPAGRTRAGLQPDPGRTGDRHRPDYGTTIVTDPGGRDYGRTCS